MTKPVSGVTGKGRKLAEFRAAHDKDFIVPSRIRAGLRALGSGWEYEMPFARMIGVNLTDLGNYRAEFADYVVEIRRDSKRVWSGNVATAKAMREMVS